MRLRIRFNGSRKVIADELYKEGHQCATLSDDRFPSLPRNIKDGTRAKRYLVPVVREVEDKEEGQGLTSVPEGCHKGVSEMSCGRYG